MNRNFLAEILAQKRHAIAQMQEDNSVSRLRERALEVRKTAVPHRLLHALVGTPRWNASPARTVRSARRTDHTLKIIAEFKRRSPSAGIIRSDVSAADVARCYERGGACAISVLTNAEYFDGSVDDLIAVRAITDLPILRKDFIIDAIQVYEAASAGADAVLLIVAAVHDRLLRELRELTEDQLGLDALVEVHTSAELRRAVNAGATLIGVNNRDLQTFQVSLATSEQLIADAPRDRIMISESGLHSSESIRRLHELGFLGFLIGETLMRAPNPEMALRNLVAEAGALPAVNDHLQ